MGPGAVGAGGHNGVEGHLLAPPAEQLIDQPGGDLPLGHAGADEVQNGLEGLVGNGLGPAHQDQLPLVLGGAQAVQQVLGGGKDTGQGLGVLLMGVHRHGPALEAHVVELLGLDVLPDKGQMALVRGSQQDLRPGDLLPGGLDVPAVGGVLGSVLRHQQQALPVEAQGVPLPGLAGDQHGVQAVLRQLGGDFFNVVHNIRLLIGL